MHLISLLIIALWVFVISTAVGMVTFLGASLYIIVAGLIGMRKSDRNRVERMRQARELLLRHEGKR